MADYISEYSCKIGYMNYETKPETIEFILAQMQDALERQYREGRALSSQVMQIFGGSTLATALFGLSYSLEHLDALTTILYSVGFLVYFVASLLTFRNMSVNLLQSQPQVTLLSSDSRQKYVPELSQELLKDVKRTYCGNVGSLQDRARGKTFLICAVVAQFQLFILGAYNDFLARADSQFVGSASFSEHWPGIILGIAAVLAIIYSLHSFVFSNVPKNVARLFIVVVILLFFLMLLFSYLELAEIFLS